MDSIDLTLLTAKAAAVVAFLAYAAWRPSPFLRIVVLCFAAQAAYAMVQDQFTARISTAYFTVGHPRIGDIDDPTLLGLAWGLMAGGSGGLIIGLLVGVAATSGRRPPILARELVVPLSFLIAAEAAVTAIGGLGAYLAGNLARVELRDPLAMYIPPSGHLPFVVVACAHFGTYASATIGTVVLCVWAVRRRIRSIA